MDGLTPRSAQTPLQTPSTWTRISAHHHFFPSNWEPNTEIYEDNARGIRLAWDSRSHRKGIPAVPLDDAQDDSEKGAASLVTKWRIKRNAIRWVGFDWWDITWWVASESLPRGSGRARFEEGQELTASLPRSALRTAFRSCPYPRTGLIQP